ncbi:MAG: response regulator [Candidatus Aminicenantes bacterium]|nr:response regulator [Candidatus Aminicenantes bacterium]
MNLLLLSDKPESYSWLEKSLSSGEFRFHSSRKKGDFFSLIRKRGIKIVILDLTRDDLSEFALLRKIKNIDPLVEVIIAGPKVSPSKMAESIKAGANDYLIKPMKAETLQPVLEKIKEKSYIRHETFKLEKELTERYIFQGMVGKNLHMLEVTSLIERVARHSVPVLVTGETGTGKEIVARALHNLSPRGDKNLVICDCTAIPETLFES